MSLNDGALLGIETSTIRLANIRRIRYTLTIDGKGLVLEDGQM
jgi:hypothetical protein